MIWTLIEVGGIIFWLLFAALIVFEFIWYNILEADWDKTFYDPSGYSSLGAIGFAVFILLIWLFGDFNLPQFISINFPIILVACISYLVFGIIWGFVKWEFWSSKQRKEYNQVKKEWLKKQNVPEDNIPENLKSQWTEYAVNKFLGFHVEFLDNPSEWNAERIKKRIVPKVSENKSIIIYWMTYWPISLLCSLLSDVIKGIWEFIYNKIGKFLQKRSESHFKGIESEFSLKQTDTTDVEKS